MWPGSCKVTVAKQQLCAGGGVAGTGRYGHGTEPERGGPASPAADGPAARAGAGAGVEGSGGGVGPGHQDVDQQHGPGSIVGAGAGGPGAVAAGRGDGDAARCCDELQELAGRYEGLASDGSGTEMVGASCGGRSWPLLAVGWPGAGCCAGLGRGITPGLRQRRAVLLWGSVAFCGVAMLWQGFCVAGNAFGPLPLPPRSLRTLNRLRSALYT